MHKRIFLFAIATVLVFSGNAYTAKDDLVFSDLSLAGYRIGMTYDEATAVRPFHYVGEDSIYEGKPYYRAKVEHTYVDDVEMDLIVDFVDEKIQKVIGRFHPAALEDMIKRLHVGLGQGENRSRILLDKNGNDYRQVIYWWDFPDAKMHLVGLSSQREFVAVSLVAKREEIPKEQAEGPG